MDDNPTPTNDADLTLGGDTFADRLTTLRGALIESDGGHDYLYLGSPFRTLASAPARQRCSLLPATGTSRPRLAITTGSTRSSGYHRISPASGCGRGRHHPRRQQPPTRMVEGAADTIGQLAGVVVDLFKDVYGIPLPGLLAYAGHGPRVDAGGYPRPDPDRPDADRHRAWPADSGQMGAVHHFVTRDGLTSLLDELLRGRFDEVESVDGEYHLRHEGHYVVVRARPDQPAVEIVTRLVQVVRGHHIALTEIDILNRDSIWTKFVLRCRDVFMDINVPDALRREPPHEMLSVFLEAIEALRDDLALRTGGRAG